jgi:hypothetical protein
MRWVIDREARVVPKMRPKHHSYDESVDEPATLLDREAVEIEREVPAEDKESVETTEPKDESSAFEE